MQIDKIQTLHPTKTGRSIDVNKYEPIKKAMLSVLKNKELTHDELMDAMNKKLKGKFDGNIGWYSETVKLDLEARKVVERVGKKPQKYRLK
jgi:hypothetical protein